ncbi:ead/Ea22-like family protein [Citrobacter koseri]|uniref:ead/Ea22-like family protein n=1 Tax=Citrobacter koseri TaxID=545 RepID=UPI002B471D2A|nr:ead/Ea22-like family protein [Citrobacter koseri]MEB3109294.1 ead/Ea22-like family protein [Citrobacter koseri]
MSNIDKKALRQLAEKAISAEGVTWWSEHQLSHEDGLALHDADAKFIAAASPATILALLDEMEVLQSFRTAYMEWSDKTDWVQTDKRLDVIKPWGKHRADVLKLYIDHLESNLEAAEHTAAVDHEAACSLVEENEELKRKLEAAEQCIAELEARTVTIKQFDEFQICHYGATEDYAKGYIDCQNNYNKALNAAGIGKEE